MNINANMKSVHSITGIPGSKKKRLPKNSGVFLLVSDSHTLGFPNPERLRRSEVCRMDIYHYEDIQRGYKGNTLSHVAPSERVCKCALSKTKGLTKVYSITSFLATQDMVLYKK